jgi:hypothetical protein
VGFEPNTSFIFWNLRTFRHATFAIDPTMPLAAGTRFTTDSWPETPGAMRLGYPTGDLASGSAKR